MHPFAFDLVVDAVRKTPPSDLDSRMSLFNATTGAHVMTNDDDAANATTDSHIGGTLPAAGDYVVVVDNVSTTATDLTYQLRFTLR